MFGFAASVQDPYTSQQYTSIIQSVLSQINPIRISRIRRNLNFTAVPYQTYTKLQEEYNQANQETLPEIPNALFLEAKFHQSFFPTLVEEMYEHYNFLNRKLAPKFYDYQGFSSLNTPNYHSLVHAAYELSQAVNSVWETSKKLKEYASMITVEPVFYTSADDDSAEDIDNIKIALTISMFQ